MNKQEQERIFKSMDELKDMLADIELDVRTAGGYSLEYDIQQLANLMRSVREGLVDYFENGIEDERDDINRLTGRKQMKPLDEQIGGVHYKCYSPQPVEHIAETEMPYCVANAFKYLVRYPNKNGIEDIRKAVHYLELSLKIPHQSEVKTGTSLKNADWISENKLKFTEEQYKLLWRFNSLLYFFEIDFSHPYEQKKAVKEFSLILKHFEEAIENGTN